MLTPDCAPGGIGIGQDCRCVRGRWCAALYTILCVVPCCAVLRQVWQQRPLTDELLRYAACDVRYMHALMGALSAKLSAEVQAKVGGAAAADRVPCCAAGAQCVVSQAWLPRAAFVGVGRHGPARVRAVW